MSTDNDKKLTDKQKRFCEEYVIDWNATRAAKAAGYSEDTARQQGSNTLSKVYIQDYIKQITEDISKLAGLSKLGVLNQLKKVIYCTDQKKTQQRDKLKALEVVNKMLGFNEAEKSEVKQITELLGNVEIVEDDGTESETEEKD